MSHRLGVLALCLGALFVFGCSAGEARSRAEEELVPTFHAQYDRNQFDAIYDGATDEFRKSTSKADYDQFMNAVRKKLGRVKSTSRQTWNVNVGTGGTRVVLTYDTEFENGKGSETFTFLQAGSEPKLLGYQINSNVLVTK